MDTIPVTIPDAPKPDEMVRILEFATGRPNARIEGRIH
jgi:hypothetical protein